MFDDYNWIFAMPTLGKTKLSENDKYVDLCASKIRRKHGFKHGDMRVIDRMFEKLKKLPSDKVILNNRRELFDHARLNYRVLIVIPSYGVCEAVRRCMERRSSPEFVKILGEKFEVWKEEWKLKAQLYNLAVVEAHGLNDIRYNPLSIVNNYIMTTVRVGALGMHKFTIGNYRIEELRIPASVLSYFKLQFPGECLADKVCQIADALHLDKYAVVQLLISNDFDVAKVRDIVYTRLGYPVSSNIVQPLRSNTPSRLSKTVEKLRKLSQNEEIELPSMLNG
jgi:hypothetical protein